MRWKTFDKLKYDHFDLEEKKEIADFFSLKNQASVDRVFNKYGSALFACEDFCMQNDYY